MTAELTVPCAWRLGCPNVAYCQKEGFCNYEKLNKPIKNSQVDVPALHASAPPGHKCADCTMDGEACPVCYTAWWRAKHPEHINSDAPSVLALADAACEAASRYGRISSGTNQRLLATALDAYFAARHAK